MGNVLAAGGSAACALLSSLRHHDDALSIIVFRNSSTGGADLPRSFSKGGDGAGSPGGLVIGELDLPVAPLDAGP